MKTSKLLLSAVVACAFATSSMVANAADLTLRFANVSTKSSIDAATVLMDVADKESNGRLKIEHFPNNVLGDDRLVLESTMMGDVGMCQIATSELAPLVADMNIYDAPFIFNTPADAWKFVDSEQGKKIAAQLEERGLKLLAMLELGFRNYTNNAHPVHVPADVKGQKMRVLNSDVHIAMWKAWGANPTPMAWGEVIPGLQQGTIDSQEHPNVGMLYNRLYEVQHYISYTQHVFTVQPLVMSKEVFDNMDEQMQNALLKAVAAYQEKQRQLSDEIDASAEAVYKDFGCEVNKLTDAERQQWRDAAEKGGVYDKVKSLMTHPEILDAVLSGKY
jgi:tripartite ATP-independent transporter DctP family solute receptor